MVVRKQLQATNAYGLEADDIDYEDITDALSTTLTRMQNGSFTLHKVDGRKAAVKRCKEHFFHIVNDLGNFDELSALEVDYARRLAFVSYALDDFETTKLEGTEKVNMDKYLNLLKTRDQLVKTLGIKKRMKTINGNEPGTLEDYFKNME